MVAKVVAGAVAALALAGLAGAASTDTFQLEASLSASGEVPRPTGVPSGAGGAFTGRATEQGARARFTWRLTFRKLSGRATAAHIHSGRPGKAGGVLVPLCGPCRSGQRGSAMLTRAQLRTIRAGRAYVNVHTARNAAGEIRGQLKATRTGEGDGSAPPPVDPPPPTAPPPYP